MFLGLDLLSTFLVRNKSSFNKNHNTYTTLALTTGFYQKPKVTTLGVEY